MVLPACGFHVDTEARFPREAMEVAEHADAEERSSPRAALACCDVGLEADFDSDGADAIHAVEEASRSAAKNLFNPLI